MEQYPWFEPTRLTVARMRRGWTKKELAEAIGVSASAVSAYESRTKRPSSATAQRISDALGFPLPFFYGDEIEIGPRLISGHWV